MNVGRPRRSTVGVDPPHSVVSCRLFRPAHAEPEFEFHIVAVGYPKLRLSVIPAQRGRLIGVLCTGAGSGQGAVETRSTSEMATQGSAPSDAAIYQHFSPHRAGLPNLIDYFREL